MIGLPVSGHGLGEAKAIVEFFERLCSRITMQLNVNVGTFVPKPHTPFQWSDQLSEDAALESINFLRSALRRFKNVKLSYHSPFVSQLEGVIARGDERVGELIFSAYARGSRLDAWEERFDRDLWRSVLDEADWPVRNELCSAKDTASELAWDDIGIRVSKATLRREFERSQACESTSACMENCNEPCGVCGDELQVVKPSPLEPPQEIPEKLELEQKSRKIIGRMVFRFSKREVAAYLQHLSIVEAFDKAFLIAKLPVAYSEGFNPMPRFETAQPLPIAVESIGEIASLLLYETVEPKSFVEAVNASLPDGLRIEEASFYALKDGVKQRTIGSLEWGSEYRISVEDPAGASGLRESIQAVLQARAVPDALVSHSSGSDHLLIRIKLPKNKDHGLLRILEACSERRPVQGFFRITRTAVFADVGEGRLVSFFDAYAVLN